MTQTLVMFGLVLIPAAAAFGVAFASRRARWGVLAVLAAVAVFVAGVALNPAARETPPLLRAAIVAATFAPGIAIAALGSHFGALARRRLGRRRFSD